MVGLMFCAEGEHLIQRNRLEIDGDHLEVKVNDAPSRWHGCKPECARQDIVRLGTVRRRMQIQPPSLAATSRQLSEKDEVRRSYGGMHRNRQTVGGLPSELTVAEQADNLIGDVSLADVASAGH